MAPLQDRGLTLAKCLNAYALGGINSNNMCVVGLLTAQARHGHTHGALQACALHGANPACSFPIAAY